MTSQNHAIAHPLEAHAFLESNPDVQFFEILFTAMSGVPRGKRLRRHELMAVYEYGRFLPGSVLVCDITGQDCEDTGLVWEDGDADRLAKPAPKTLVRAPWLQDGPNAGAHTGIASPDLLTKAVVPANSAAP